MTMLMMKMMKMEFLKGDTTCKQILLYLNVIVVFMISGTNIQNIHESILIIKVKKVKLYQNNNLWFHDS